MKNVILGTGISAYIIAACLDYDNEDFVICGNGNYTPPSILYLKYDSQEELEYYFNIFGIPCNDMTRECYTKEVKIGFLGDDGIVHECPTDKMIENYYKKQNRRKTDSAMSDGRNTFNAIRLDKIYKWLESRFAGRTKEVFLNEKYIKELYDEGDMKIYNTVFGSLCNDNTPEYEYIKYSKSMPIGFDYVYDCRANTNVKRYSDSHTELFKYDGTDCVKCINYYHSPTIYSTKDIKKNVEWIDISRNASKTQLKQEDIIEYMLGKVEWEI